AAPLPLRYLVVAEALLLRAVHVGVARIAAGVGSLEERFAQRMGVGRIGHRERPADAVILVRPALIVLRLAEVRQHVRVAPPGVAEIAPVVVVLALAADVDRAVDRAGAAQHLAARLRDGAAARLLVRFALE